MVIHSQQLSIGLPVQEIENTTNKEFCYHDVAIYFLNIAQNANNILYYDSAKYLFYKLLLRL